MGNFAKLFSYLVFAIFSFNPCQSSWAFPESLDEFGTRIKVMVSVFQRDHNEPSNIFIPKVQLAQRAEFDFLKYKGKVCVFASGGLTNSWEKTVSKAYFALFGERIKIIRARWILKKLKPTLWEEYQGHPQDLHSELYFKWFMDTFSRSVTEVNGFSWWRPCDTCHQTLQKQETLYHRARYQVSYMKPYKHKYADTFDFRGQQAPDYKGLKNKVWNDIWTKIVAHADRQFSTPLEKKTFWTNTYCGLALSKWLGQVLINKDIESSSSSESAIDFDPKALKHLPAVAPEELKRVQDLIQYLREENWELSCWYKAPLPSPLQSNWNKFWGYHVMPHFGWEELSVEEADEDQECQMCGYPRLRELHYVFSSKHTPSEKTDISSVHKRKKSLIVGSECVKLLKTDKAEIERLQQEALKEFKRKQREEEEKLLAKERKRQELVAQRELFRQTEEAERELRRQEIARRKQEKELHRQEITRRKQEKLERQQARLEHLKQKALSEDNTSPKPSRKRKAGE